MGISLIAGIAIPAMVIGIPVYVGRKVGCAHFFAFSIFRFVGKGLKEMGGGVGVDYISEMKTENQLALR